MVPIPNMDVGGTESGAAIEDLAPEADNINSCGNREDKLMICASNHEEAFFTQQAMVADESKDADINITESVDDGHETVEAAEQDATESSSSFGDTNSGLENGLTHSDDEVDSQFYGGNPSPWVCDGYAPTSQTRKRRLTEHWMSFIRPLMWRCKWIEMQIHKLQFQASKYAKELAICDQRKHFQLDDIASQESGAKSLPFLTQSGRMKYLRRKKRKKVEDTTDVASYMSNHCIFSYYESKKSSADSFLGNIFASPGLPVAVDKRTKRADEIEDVNKLLPSRHSNDCLEQILWKIDKMQARACKLRARVDKVVSENPRNFTSVNKPGIVVQGHEKTSYHQDPLSYSSDGERTYARSLSTTSRPLSRYHAGDLRIQENGITSHELVAYPYDGTSNIDRSASEDLSEKPGDGIFRNNNQKVKAELFYFQNDGSLPTKKRWVLKEFQEEAISSDCGYGSEPPTEAPEVRTEKSKSIFESRMMDTNKYSRRKRGERKAGPGRWG